MPKTRIEFITARATTPRERDDALWCSTVEVHIKTRGHARTVHVDILGLTQDEAVDAADVYVHGLVNGTPNVNEREPEAPTPVSVAPTLEAIAENDARQGRGG